MAPDGYIPITVERAINIANECEKNVVVIVAWDKKHGQIHTTTFGKSAEEKVWAANLGEKLNEVAGGYKPEGHYFEDFRLINSAKSKEMIDELHRKLKAARDSLKTIGDRSATPWVAQEATAGLMQSE